MIVPIVNIKRAVNNLWWKLMPGTVIMVPWPVGVIKNVITADPNEHYRPWMEINVGKQGWDWDWKIASSDSDKLAIKFRKGKSQHALIFILSRS